MNFTENDILFDSIRAAAAWTGFPIGLFRKVKAEGCDAFVNTRVSLQKFIRFLAQSGQSESDLPDGFSSWADFLNKMKSQREAIKLEKDRGLVLDLTEARQSAAEAEAWYFSELERMKREVPSAAEGLPALGIFNVLDKFIADLRKTSREKFQATAEPTK